MRREAETLFLALVKSVTHVEFPTFPWLTNIFDPIDEDIRPIFSALDGDFSGMNFKSVSKLRPDAYLPALNCILEFDEAQHFTIQRKISLTAYPPGIHLGYDRQHYISLCQIHHDSASKKGPPGFRKPTKDFPFSGGRHSQRALFDSFRDILPLRNGLSPTIRISEFDTSHIRNYETKTARGLVSQLLGL